jgi:PAS domain S-box-containing protein
VIQFLLIRVLINLKVNATMGIQFSDLFDKDEIQHLQDLFADATGVASVITHPDGAPITKPSNFCRLCSEIIRNTESGRSNCFRSDSEIGRPSPDGPIIKPCLSGGLWDAGASIIVGGKHIANWLIGQVKNEELDHNQMMKYADEIGADKKAFLKALDEVPQMSKEKFTKVAQMLFAVANQISSKAYQNYQLQQSLIEHKRTEEAYTFGISEQKQNVMALKTSNAKYRAVFESTGSATLLVETDNTISLANHECINLTGYSHEELIGQKWTRFVENESLEKMIKNHNLRRQNPSLAPKKYEVKLVNKSGEIRYAMLDIGMVMETGQSIVSILDITDRINAENALITKADELERFNKLMLGRELKMIELKKEINELLKKAGKNIKYSIQE